MFLVVAMLIFLVAILVFAFPEHIVSILLTQQRQLMHFFHQGPLPKMYAKLLDDQSDSDARFRYRKMWVRFWMAIVILLDVLALVFYLVSE